jgi:hypothetical protein
MSSLRQILKFVVAGLTAPQPSLNLPFVFDEDWYLDQVDTFGDLVNFNLEFYEL